MCTRLSRNWTWVVLAAASLAMALAPGPPARGETPAQRRAAAALESEVVAACASADQQIDLVARVNALRAAAGAKPAWLFAAAPTALQWAARHERLGGDLAAARASYQAWLELAPRRHPDRALMVKEQGGLEAERRLRAAGLAPPGPGWMVWELRAVALPGGPAAAAAIWVRADCRAIAPGEASSAVVLYDLGAGDGRGRKLGTDVVLTDALLSFAPERPAADLTGTGVPVLVLRAAAGGQCWGCNRLRLLRADGNGLAELDLGADPQVVPFAVADVSADGRLAVIASDARWEGFVGLCPSCAPVTTMIYRWREGRFVETCREERVYYGREIINAAALLGQETLADYALGRATQLLLDRLQQGAGEEAWAAYLGDLATVAAMAGAREPMIAAARQTLRLALDRAGPAMRQRGCPVLGLELP